LVVDCVIGPTKLIDLARRGNKQTITGAEIYVAQFKHQFKIYTGQEPDTVVVEQVAKDVFNV
jgi:shikimate 5-dehydrogenase